MSNKVKETLEKQLELLSERAQNQPCQTHELVEMSLAMAEIAKTIMYPIWYQEAEKASHQCLKES